ncbi:hypothetical protein ABZ595_08050 [Streptomyces rubradiris]|uniref:hypothetical protein n=1 Tax=Streptomyces rubradiris TaxID=285531 RepID=UPI0033E75022
MNEYGTRSGAAPVEERLRAALAARAHAVGPADLRPLSPPAAPVRSRRARARRMVVGGMALAAVAALVILTLVLSTTHDGQPAPPARSPHPRTGIPSPAPSPATPSPAPATPTPRAAHP